MGSREHTPGAPKETAEPRHAQQAATQAETGAPTRAHPLSHAGILHLQRTLGNRAVGRILAGTVPPPRVQRTLKLTATNEEYTPGKIMDFIMKHGMGIPGELAGPVQKLIDDPENVHEFDDLAALVKQLGGGKKEEEVVEEKPSWTVFAVLDRLGMGVPDLDEGDAIIAEKSGEQSSHPLFNVELSGKRYVLKGEPSNKSEFAGMQAMAEQGLRVPSTLSLMLSDGKDYILMEYVPYLATGLRSFTGHAEETLEEAGLRLERMGSQLGRVHVTDVRILNVDRLPWRANGYTGHLNNVFVTQDQVLGMDSEKDMDETEEKNKDRQAELEEMAKDPAAYATRMAELLSRPNKDKLMLEEEHLPFFIKGFAAGIAAALGL